MRLFLNQHQQVAVDTPAAGSISLTRNRKLHTFLYTGRNLNGHHLILTHQTFSVTLSTLMGDDFPFALTGGTGRSCLHLSQYRIADARNLTRTTTSGTIAVRRTVGSSDRKSTRLNSSHVRISYAVFCL